MSASNSTTTKRRRLNPNCTIKSVTLTLKPLTLPLTSSSTNTPIDSIRLTPTTPTYTIGRSKRLNDFVFHNSKRCRFVSKQHCCIQLNVDRGDVCVVDKISLNGVFVNGVRVRVGVDEAVVVSEGDVVGVGCGGASGLGFGVERIVVERRGGSVVGRGEWLLRLCRNVLDSDDPISSIRKLRFCDGVLNGVYKDNVDGEELDERNCFIEEKRDLGNVLNLGDVDGSVEHKEQCSKIIDDCLVDCDGVLNDENDENVDIRDEDGGELDSDKCFVDRERDLGNVLALEGEVDGRVEHKAKHLYSKIVDDGLVDCFQGNEGGGFSCPPQPGKRFYLNNLKSVKVDLSVDHVSVTLPELLHPVESLSGIFIATFTSDIPWFLRSCNIPVHLPVTIVCHNTERCWSANPDSRFSVPFSDFPKLVVVYPLFPETIAFGADRTKRGVACHHPKLLVLLRKQAIRVIITSANLNEKQWNGVTNTVWWQDFPRATVPDFLSFFSCLPDADQVSKSDFAAQLARLVAILVTDVPSQVYWVREMANYDFSGADGHLVVSIPGIHSLAPYISESKLTSFAAHVPSSLGSGYLGSIDASVVGLSHLFCTKADSKGLKLKKLAFYFANCRTTAYGMLEVVLRRNKNIPADANAVSVFVPNQDNISEGDCVQLGFLPRYAAKWVSPLWDAGLFKFSGYIYPREAIEVALGKTNGKKVRLSLHVSQGPNFSNMSSIMQAEHATALCTLIASVKRCSGLWRLQEVIGRYSWPEPLETDFVFGSSSIGSSINPQFLATFSAAIGKKMLNYPDSEESDPEWGRWSTSQESKNPSMKIIFPSIERVKNSVGGIMPSKRLLCLREKTWQNLRPAGIFHDAVPHPESRVGHPMHVKVGMRRFQSKTDASSFGWVYCGSHNFSAAAWGRVINSTENKRRDSDEMQSFKNYSSGPKLHICNYEVGIVFLFPPPGTKKLMQPYSKKENSVIDKVKLPFVMPPPKYKPSDRPATFQALKEAMLVEFEKRKYQPLPLEEAVEEEEEEEMVEDEPGDVVEAVIDATKENEDEKAYAEELWSQVDSLQGS